MSNQNNRKNLVIVRAGEKSLHPQWLTDSERNWDIVVSYYGENPERYINQCDYWHHFKGSKWEGLSAFVSENRDMINVYDYLWLPDDDLFTTTGNINHFFTLCKNFDFCIAQPALTLNSYYSWDITRQKSGTICRMTDFVEIMAPCFKVDNLSLFADTFKLNSSGWGLEWLWRNIAEQAEKLNFGIVDSTPVFHTRKVGSIDHGGANQSPGEEMKKILEDYGLVNSKPRVIRNTRNPQGTGFFNQARDFFVNHLSFFS